MRIIALAVSLLLPISALAENDQGPVLTPLIVPKAPPLIPTKTKAPPLVPLNQKAKPVDAKTKIAPAESAKAPEASPNKTKAPVIPESEQLAPMTSDQPAPQATAEKKDWPTIAVVLMRRLDLPKSSADDVATAISKAIQAAGVPVTLPPTTASQKLKQFNLESESCGTDKECLLKMGIKLGVQVIVGIQVGALGKNVTIDVGVFTVPEGLGIAAQIFSAQKDNLKKIAGLEAFGEKLQIALRPKPPPEEVKSAQAETKSTEPTKAPEAQPEPTKPVDQPKPPEVKVVEQPKDAPRELKTTTSTTPKPQPKKKVAVLDVRAIGTFDPKAVGGLTTFVASETEKNGFKVIAGSDIAAIIGFEKQRSILGCTEGSCLAEIGGAIGADYLLQTEVSEVGGIWLLTITLIDVNRTVTVKRVTKEVEIVKQLIENARTSTAEALAVLPSSTKRQEVIEIAKPVEESHTGHTIMQVAGYGLAGVGVLAVGLGGYFGLQQKSAADGVKPGIAQTEAYRLKAESDKNGKNANLCFIAGGVTAAVGLALGLTGTLTTPSASNPITVSVGPGGGILSGTF